MLRELNFALTGEEKSFIVELWVLTLLSIWILTKFSDLSLHKGLFSLTPLSIWILASFSDFIKLCSPLLSSQS